ncbi:uncharacterized protein LOC110271857 [Arachis ipaensis]|uniref:uncharacterized protein LOC110271857 n=1 Tax=Arachis ipaensis TaxID=130454 RepID=UPI000A2B8ACE|nr:uncharacterized protein LOC110271857 [Arachis ipaensis]
MINYLGGKYPGVSASNLRAQLKTKNLYKEGSSSNPTKVDGGGEVDQPMPVKKNFVFKKRKIEDVNLDSDVGEKNEGIPLEELSSFVKNQEKLHGFLVDDNSSSLWDKKFPFMVVADEVLQSASDQALVEEVGDVAVNQYL